MEKPQKLRYKKTPSFATSHGPMYEVKLVALLFLRFKNSSRDFQIASNVDGAGALDDIVVKFKETPHSSEWHSIFLQLKHRQSAQLRLGALLASGGNFSLKKYLKSYLDIKTLMSTDEDDRPVMFDGSFDKCSFILYTNARTENGLSMKGQDIALTEVESMLETYSPESLVIQFTPERDADIYDSFKDLEDSFLEAKEFLRKLKIFTGQATETELDKLIKNEVMVRFKNFIGVDILYHYYEELIKNWCQTGDCILDKHCDFLERAFTETVSIQQQEVFRLNINFNEDFWSDYELGLSEDISFLHIESCGMKVSCSKVLQYLRNSSVPFIFLGVDSLMSEGETTIPVWCDSETDILVVVGGYDDDTNQWLMKVCDVLEKKPKKKLVYFSNNRYFYDNVGPDIKSKLGTKFRSVKNTFGFSHLDKESKCYILNRELLFQGEVIILDRMFDDIPHLTDMVCNAQLVETLLSNETLIIGPPLGDVIDYYIPRSLISQTVVNQEILKVPGLTDVFAVSNISTQELQELTPSGERVVSSTNPDRNLARFIVLNSTDPEQDYNELCTTTNFDSVHWLRFEHGGQVKWMRSYGDIDLICHCIDEEFVTDLRPESVLDVSDRVVLLVAEPGMGKSTLMSYFARETKRRQPNLWVVRVNLKDHTDLLETEQDPVQFLAAAVGIKQTSALEFNFFKFSVEVEGNCAVLLDGFDEIAPSYADLGCSLLKKLINTKVKKIWVTSRASVNSVLEKTLLSLSYNLSKFSDEDQRLFFKKFWANVTTPMSDNQLEGFVTQLLQLVSRSLNDKEKHFTGIPLQTMMLAEVFEGCVRDPKNNPLPVKLNLLHLFETVIEKKFNIYAQKRSIVVDRNSTFEVAELRKRLVKSHMKAALVLLIDEKEIENLHSKEKIIKKTDKFLKNIEESKDKTGIVDGAVNGKPRFIHRTFAEYFAAKWFSKCYEKNMTFLESHLFTAHFTVIQEIFNSILASESRVHTAVLGNDVFQVEAILNTEQVDVNSTDQGGRTLLHLASSLGFSHGKSSEDRFTGPRPKHLTELLLEHGANMDVLDNVLKWTPLKYALWTKSWDAAEILLENKTPQDGISWGEFNFNDPELWAAMIEHGLIKLMRVLLDNGLAVESRFGKHHHLLHKAVIHGREELVRLLMSRGSVVQPHGYWEELLILAAGYGHSRVVMVLVKRAAKDRSALARYVNWRDKKGRTAMSESARFGHTDVLRVLTKCGATVWTRDRLGETPLHRASGQGNMGVVSALLEGAGAAYINAPNKEGQTAVHRAAEDKHVEVLMALIQAGGSVWAKDGAGKMPVHLAAERGHLQVMQVLVNSLGGDRSQVLRYLMSTDKLGRTPQDCTSEQERFKWSFDHECEAVSAWMDQVLNDSP